MMFTYICSFTFFIAVFTYIWMRNFSKPSSKKLESPYDDTQN